MRHLSFRLLHNLRDFKHVKFQRVRRQLKTVHSLRQLLYLFTHPKQTHPVPLLVRNPRLKLALPEHLEILNLSLKHLLILLHRQLQLIRVSYYVLRFTLQLLHLVLNL